MIIISTKDPFELGKRMCVIMNEEEEEAPNGWMLLPNR